MKDVDEALHDAVHVFNRLNLPYAVMGGLAVRVWSIPRATRDVDVTIGATADDVPRLSAAFEELGDSIPEAYVSGWTDQVAGMPLMKFRWYMAGRDLDMDVFLAETPFQHSIIARRCLAQAEDLDVWVVGAEDMILLKLVAGRPRDLVDVADILFMQGQLDEAYMRKWADRLGARDALEHSLANHPGDTRP